MDRAEVLKTRVWLNACTAAYLIYKLFGSKLFGLSPEECNQYVAFFAGALLLWQVAIGWAMFPDTDTFLKPTEENRRNGYVARYILILWAGHSALATDPFGFWVFVAIEVFVIVALIYLTAIAHSKKLDIGTMVVGILIVLFLFSTWTKQGIVENYGVPIIGHWLEKKSYDTKHLIQIEPKVSGRTLDIMADIHVENSTEYEDEGDNNYGQTIVSAYSRRRIWINTLYFSGSRKLGVSEQSEPLDVGEKTFIKDSSGFEWYVGIRTME